MEKREVFNYFIVGTILLVLVGTLFFLKGGITGYAILNPEGVIERGSNWDKLDEGNGNYNLKIYNNQISRYNGSEYVPIVYGPCGNNCFRDRNGLIYRVGSGGSYIKLYDPDDNFITNFGFAITGNIGATNYKYSTLNFTWIWTSENTTDEYIFRGYNNRTNFNWTQEFHFYSNQSMKIKNIVTNNLGANIQNTKFWFIQTVNQSDGVWFNGTRYNQDIHKTGQFDSLISNIRFEDNYFFDYNDLLANGFNITDFYLGNGSVIGVGNIRILAIGITKGNSVFPNGVTVVVDPTITISGDGKDAYVKGDKPNNNFGSDSELWMKETTQKRYPYLEFNISSIPDNQVIDNASLCLYLFVDQGSDTISVHHVYENWSEAGITWNNQPCGTSFDNSTNCNLTAESNLSNDGSQDDTWQCWNIKNMVSQEYNNNSEKISIILQSTDSGNTDKFYSKEHSNASLWPYLNITYHISDSIPPNITINNPTNTTITTTTITFNITVLDDTKVNSCLYSLDSGSNLTLTNSSTSPNDYTTTNSTMSQGSHTVNFYCNDTNNNLNNSETTTFFIDSISPTINLIFPQDGASYGYNDSINLNFSATDPDNNIDVCWYNLNNGANTTINNCQNTTFNVSGDGTYNITIYVNDSANLVSKDNATFTVQVGAPTITLHSPIDTYLNNQEVEFNYTPSDVDLDSCELWGDFSGIFTLNQTDLSPTSGLVNNFNLNLADNTYLWNIKCNDTQGNLAVNGNKTFYVDTVNPTLSLTEPTGSKSSRDNIPLEFSTNDSSPISCLYNIYSGASLEVSNTTINCNESSSFNVSTDASFDLNFYVNDSAGNKANSSSSFTVSTSSDGGGGGSSSSGGGGSSGGGSILANGELQVSQLGTIISREGDNKTLSISAKNIGQKFLNDCRLIITGEITPWVYFAQIQGIAPGENIDFLFELNVPQDTSPRDYSGLLEIKCKEDNNTQNLEVSILEGLGALEIKEIIKESNKLNIIYTFDNRNFIGDNVDIDIWVVDDDGIEIKRVRDSFSINKDGLIERNISIELPRNSVGVHEVYFALSSELENYSKRSVILGRSYTTGQAILNVAKGKGLPYIIFLLIIGTGVFFIFRSHRKSMREGNKKN